MKSAVLLRFVPVGLKKTKNQLLNGRHDIQHNDTHHKQQTVFCSCRYADSGDYSNVSDVVMLSVMAPLNEALSNSSKVPMIFSDKN
jgi:hypothetical protein